VVGPRGVWTRGCRPEGVLSSHNKNPPCVFDGEAVPLSDVADTRAYVCAYPHLGRGRQQPGSCGGRELRPIRLDRVEAAGLVDKCRRRSSKG
jgi:hypothetical protein